MMANDTIDYDDAKEQFDAMADTFNMLMGVKTDKLSVPVEKVIGFDGEEAEARGSARHVTEEIEQEGYMVTREYIGETENAFGEERHEFRIKVE